MNDADDAVRVLFGVVMLLLGGVGWFMRTLDRRLTRLEEHSPMAEQRLTALEAHYSNIMAWLARIEGKLDRVVTSPPPR